MSYHLEAEVPREKFIVDTTMSYLQEFRFTDGNKH